MNNVINFEAAKEKRIRAAKKKEIEWFRWCVCNRGRHLMSPTERAAHDASRPEPPAWYKGK